MTNKLSLDELPDWPILMTIKEASRYVGLSISKFRELDPDEKITLGEKIVRYHRDDLDAWARFLKQGTPHDINDDIIEGMLI